MSKECVEVAIFKVHEDNITRAIELSKAIFSEMNKKENAIVSYKILQKTDNPCEILWNIVWIDRDTAKRITAQWPTFSSTEEFQKLVEKDVYYGHFD